jgi:transcriptional regulator ATRX
MHEQVDLYNKYLSDEVKVLSDYDGTDTNTQLRFRILTDSHVFARITAHPYMLLLHKQKTEIKQLKIQERAVMDDFIDDENTDVTDDEDGNVVPVRRGRRDGDDDRETPSSGRSTPANFRSNDWWTKTNMVTAAEENVVELGGKFVILFELLKKCEQIGDKCLIFSQRTEVLDFIEHQLKYFDRNKSLWFTNGRPALEMPSLDGKWGWRKGVDYLRIDGSTSTVERANIIAKFNDPAELRSRMMLISTRAGGVGISLTAANRVILFDVNWNPANDQQSLFRVYRFGQLKPVYIYRLVAQVCEAGLCARAYVFRDAWKSAFTIGK